MRSVIPLAMLSLLVGCTVPTPRAPREFLDEQTTATITVSAEPLILVGESSGPARRDIERNRDYLEVYGIDVNRMGDHRQYFAVMAWFPPSSTAGVAPELTLHLGNETIELEASKEEPRTLGISQPFQMLQQNLLVWFYTAFLHRTGTYLIDVYSGRLRIGVRRYRELVLGQSGDGLPQAPTEDAADQVHRVTITVMGQVKAGKSSLINALLGEQRAQTDVLPATSEITRYELQPEGVPTRLVLLDTVGIDRAAFAPTFAVGRAAGWCAHVLEQRATGRLIRPASRYVGPRIEG